MTTLPSIRTRIDDRLAREAKLTAVWGAPVATALVTLTVSVTRFGLSGSTVWVLWLTIATLGLAGGTAWTMRNRLQVSASAASVWAGSVVTAVAALVLTVALPGT